MDTSEQIKFWRLPYISGIEMLHASYIQQSFSRHMHEEFAVGVIESGNLGFSYRGRHLVASQGCINICNAGEFHTGNAQTPEGWRYRMFYIDPDFLANTFAQATGKVARIPFFQHGVINDPSLSRRLHHLHQMLESTAHGKLQQESTLLATMVEFIVRHSDSSIAVRAVGKENQKVKKVRDYIEACFTENISLQTLAQIACLSQFHLVRVFQRQIGIPPHAYLNQVRIRRAKNMLKRGLPIVQVALENGFTDQSHLYRHFKLAYGITPGEYSKNIQS